MPNHVTNQLTICGTEEEITKVLDYIRGEPEGDKKEPYYIDFNKIIPMPKELSITSDGLVTVLERSFFQHTTEELKERLKKADPSAVENFCQAVRNVAKHGHASWYPWSIEKWGTKWSAYSTKRDGNRISFDTAWSAPIPVLEALSKKFPQIRFEHTYADEDIGQNCGAGFLENGEYTKTTEFEFGSQEAKDFASDIRGYSNKERGYV